MKLRTLGVFILIVFALVIVVLGREGFLNLYKKEGGVKTLLKIGDAQVRVDIALTPPEKFRGLSARESLGEDEGMLFVFGAPQRYSFWMKNIKFPLDIVWIDENKKVVDVTYDARPESYPLYFEPRYPSQYVLEVPSGWAMKHGVESGSIVEFQL